MGESSTADEGRTGLGAECMNTHELSIKMGIISTALINL